LCFILLVDFGSGGVFVNELDTECRPIEMYDFTLMGLSCTVPQKWLDEPQCIELAFLR